jgi:hypothetical protein
MQPDKAIQAAEEPKARVTATEQITLVTDPFAPSPSRFERWETLDKLGRKPVDDTARRYWCVPPTRLDQYVEEFKAAGLLRDATDAEKLSKTHTIPQLKELLKSHGTKAQGKKAELIDALLSAMQPNEVIDATGGLELYMLTPEGETQLGSFWMERKTARELAEREALALALTGDFPGAFARWRLYNPDQHYEAVASTGSDGGTSDLPNVVRYFMQDSLYEDLDHSPEERRLIKAGIVFSVIQGNVLAGAGQHFLPLTNGQFRCKPLEEYLRSAECSEYAQSHLNGGPDLLVSLYMHTKYFGAMQATRLKEIRTQGFNNVRIACYDECPTCKRLARVYRKHELDSLPKLPLHWGCRCLYEPYMA